MERAVRAPSEPTCAGEPTSGLCTRVTHVRVPQQSAQLPQTVVDARSPLLLHQRLPGLQHITLSSVTDAQRRSSVVKSTSRPPGSTFLSALRSPKSDSSPSVSSPALLDRAEGAMSVGSPLASATAAFVFLFCFFVLPSLPPQPRGQLANGIMMITMMETASQTRRGARCGLCAPDRLVVGIYRALFPCEWGPSRTTGRTRPQPMSAQPLCLRPAPGGAGWALITQFVGFGDQLPGTVCATHSSQLHSSALSDVK